MEFIDSKTVKIKTNCDVVFFFNRRQTEELLEQFKYHLAEINNNIKDHVDQLNNTTMNIIQNEEKISKLVSGL